MAAPPARLIAKARRKGGGGKKKSGEPAREPSKRAPLTLPRGQPFDTAGQAPSPGGRSGPP
jgi:hypothetical protein